MRSKISEKTSRRYDRCKRLLDIVAASFGIVIVSPVLAIVAVLVVLFLGRPLIFAQSRPGLNGRPFRLYKFRSMRAVDVERGRLTNEQRMTRFGKILRSTSLDELPSLWNILRGEMSFVGPRPLRVAYLERYSTEQLMRHRVRPGLTGLAQVAGRNAIGWDDRLALDVDYVTRRSLALDAWVLFRTVRAVLDPRGIRGEGEATMSEFFGPEKTSRMRLVALGEQHLVRRVAWLSDPRIRLGISISFDPHIDSMHEWFARVSRDPDRVDWVGVDSENDLVSMCGIQLLPNNAATLYIYVDPERLGRGFGQETMELLISEARRRGISALELETSPSNASARRLYERLGFVPTGEIEQGQKLRMRKVVRSGHVE